MNSRRYSPVPPSRLVVSIRNNPTHRIYTLVSVASLLITALIAAIRIKHRYNINVVDESSFYNSNKNDTTSYYGANTQIVIPSTSIEKGTKVAFIGNSILYYNDSPRFLSKLVSVSSSQSFLQQDSCLHGGSSLMSIFHSGNGMEEKFHTPNARQSDGTYDIGSPTIQTLLRDTASWDYVIMNDYTQQPARGYKREKTIAFLNESYVPFFQQGKESNNNHMIPILLMTHAYRKPVKDSADLFPVANFTRELCIGYQEYARVIDHALFEQNITTRIAYVGKAFELIHNEDYLLWEKLFYIDDLHPSTYGTFLQGCVLYCTIFQEAPPIFEFESDIRSLWNDARRMYPPEDNVVVHFPSVEEAMYLRLVAERVWRSSLVEVDFC